MHLKGLGIQFFIFHFSFFIYFASIAWQAVIATIL